MNFFSENHVMKWTYLTKNLPFIQSTIDMAVKRTQKEMQNFIDQLPDLTCKMENGETSPKRQYSAEEMKWFHPELSMPKNDPMTKVDNATLEKLQQDVTSIRSNLEKKKHKVTLIQLNEKVDLILTILQSWNQ